MLLDMSPNVARRWPLVGRAQELERIREVLAVPASSGLLIVGEAGVGKTRLATEALEIALAAGLTTAWASATRAAAAIPFGAFAHLLPVGVLNVETDENLIRSAALHVVGSARRPRVAIGIDDVHLLDDRSAALVHHLAVHTQALVVATQRAGSTPPDAIAHLWKEGVCERVELGPLSEPDVATLLEGVLGSRVEGTTQQRLFEQSLGNPLLIRELVTSGLESGALIAEARAWRWNGPISPSGRLAELIDRRLATLSQAAQRTLEVVALAEPIPVSVLESIVDRGALAELEGARVVEENLDGLRRNARITQPLTATRVRSRISPARARQIASAYDSALAATGARRKKDLPLANPALDVRDSEDGRLTPRERQVARLASTGLSNKQIAERLHVSVRTVGNHLYRVYRRLGVDGRPDLARVLREEPDTPLGSGEGIEHPLLRETNPQPPNRDGGS